MKNLNLFVGLLMLVLLFPKCSKDNDGDKVQIMEITIHPDTGYGASLLSNVLTQPLMYSEENSSEKLMLVDIMTEGLDLEYQRGYKYRLKVKKVWMQHPPADVMDFKYIFIELISKEKVITENTEENLKIHISAKTIKFTPKFPTEYIESGIPKVYDAMHAKANNSDSWIAITNIEEFDYEVGYEYELMVKKVTNAEPYSVKYTLLEILSKQQKQ